MIKLNDGFSKVCLCNHTSVERGGRREEERERERELQKKKKKR